MPSNEEANHISEEIFQKTGFPYVMGIIDGTHVEISKQTSTYLDYNNVIKLKSLLFSWLVAGSLSLVKYIRGIYMAEKLQA